jgi:hypothetical protein
VGKYRHPEIDDLMLLLSFDGALKFRGLDFYAKRFGITVPDAHRGQDVAALMAAGNIEAVQAHCLADLRKIRQLAERMGIVQPVTVQA